jgi:SAM-dependent methyltransferase
MERVICNRHEYGEDFYRFLASFAGRSARRIVAELTTALPVRSVADFGCGHGAWLRVWSEAGASVTGVDGSYIDTRKLLIDRSCFRGADLTAPLSLGAKFDLVQSLEVAEHLPAGAAERFVDTLVAHGPLVLFSAAIPGQGGEHHINEQPLAYWRALFRGRGYSAIDYLRPRIAGDRTVARWYRYNVMLYAAEDSLGLLPERVLACRVPEQRPLADYRPLAYRLQNALVRRLPTGAVDGISRMKGLAAARLART